MSLNSLNAFLSELAHAVGSPHCLTTPEEMAPFCQDWRKRYQALALAVVFPQTTEIVARVVQLAAAYGVAIVPQGGNTSLCGGATPILDTPQIIVSLTKMNRILAIDRENHTLTAQAGCRLVAIQDAAKKEDQFFPLSLASEGSCTLGGVISTNAGGVAVLRYGTMRALTLGLEAVDAEGRILSGLRGLYKDNTGYDLKQLLIGAEGTLGIVTAATVRLFSLPQSTVTGWIEVENPQDALLLLNALQMRFGDRLTAFELISQRCVELVNQHFPMLKPPSAASWQVLIELSDGSPTALLFDALAECLVKLGRDEHAILAKSPAEAQRLWQARESISEAQAKTGVSIKHDIALPRSAIPLFLETTEQRLKQAFPSIHIVCFGHLGDGNLHYNLSHTREVGSPLEDEARANTIVYEQVLIFQGSISAEHGIGQLKKKQLADTKSPLEIEWMQKIRQALDPKGVFNPGKVI